MHTHLHPPRLFAAIRRWFAERSPWVLEHPTEPADVVAALRAAGVERFVFCSYAHKPGIARDLNTWLARTSREMERYGLPLGTVHLDDRDYVTDCADALADGCIGLKIHEDVQRLALDDPRWGPVYDRIAASEGFVLAHVGPIPWSNDTNDGPARVASVLERHPDLRFVVAHFGVPDAERYVDLMQTYPNLYLDTTMAFARGTAIYADADPALVARGSDRIVYGTDYPNVPYPYGAERAGLEELGLPAAVLGRILSENARGLHPELARETW